MVTECLKSFFCCSIKEKKSLAVASDQETTKEKVSALIAKVVPTLECPFAIKALNPFTEKVQEETVSWVRRFHLIQNAEDLNRFSAAKYAHLMGGVHPTCSEKALQLISDWLGWLFIYDDKNESMDWLELRLFNERVMSVLKGGEAKEDEDPSIKAMVDLRERVKEIKLCDPWMDRFIRHVGIHFSSVVIEAQNRAKGVASPFYNSPSEEINNFQTQEITSQNSNKRKIEGLEDLIPPELLPYIPDRLGTSGAEDIMFPFIEVALDLFISENLHENKLFERAKRTANIALCYENDIISSLKEVKEHKGDPTHNAIFVLNRKGYSLEDSFQKVAELYNKSVENFSRLKDLLGAANGESKQYLDEVSLWLGSHHVWAKNSVRYKG